jgi:hypothetical protein
MFMAALDMYHSMESEREWWAAAHEFVDHLAMIRELLHQDLFSHFLNIIWEVLCAGLKPFRIASGTHRAMRSD